MSRRWFVLVLAFAAATRLAYLVWFARADPLFTHLLHDAKRYHEWAATLAGGAAWQAGPYEQAPLYPLVLSVVYRGFGAIPLAGYGFGALCGIATVALVMRAGSRAFGDAAGVAAGAAASLYGIFLFSETRLLPASLSVLLAALAIERIQAADRSARAAAWLLPGAVIGLGALANPSALLLVPLTAAFVLAERSRELRARLVRAAMLCAAAAAVVAPVTIRNVTVGREPVLISTNGGITFYQGNNPLAEGKFSSPEGFSGSIFQQRAESRVLAERESGRPLLDSEVSSFWFRKGLRFLASSPAHSLRLMGKKLLLAIDDREVPLEYDPGLDENPARRILRLSFGVILGLAAGCVVARPRPGRAAAPVYLVLAPAAFVLLTFYVSGRYRLPALPSLLVLAGGGAATLLEGLRRGGRRALAPALVACGVAAASLFHLPRFFASDSERLARAMALCDLAGVYAADHSPVRAIDLYRQAIATAPSYPFAFLDLGNTLAAQGDLAGAERALGEALRLAPGSAEVQLSLGVVLARSERFGAAADRFAEAFRLDPRNSDAGNNLIGACLRSGRIGEALAAWRRMKAEGLPVDPPLERLMLEHAGRPAPRSVSGSRGLR